MKNILIFRTDRLGDFIIHSRPIYELKKFKDLKNYNCMFKNKLKDFRQRRLYR